MINYKELFERIEKGERAIDIAVEEGKSVTALYHAFEKEGLLGPKRNKLSLKEWEDYYNAYKAGMRIEDIKKETEYPSSSIYLRFAKFGYVRKPRNSVNKKELYAFYKEGMTIDELSKKYNLSYAYTKAIIKTIADYLDES